MHRLHRRLYDLLLRLHPAAFRNEFAREMALDFEDAFDTYGPARLYIDSASSLARQWSAGIFSAAPNPGLMSRASLLAGNYVVVRDRSFTAPALGFGFIASAAQIALCLFALSASPGRTPNFPIVYAASRTMGTRDPNLEASLPTDRSYGSGPKPSQSTAPSLAFAYAVVAQTAPTRPELLLFHPTGQLPCYEVATIKPLDPDTAGNLVRLPPGGSLSPLSVRRYIMNAYGAIYAPQIIGGPNWLNKEAYLIHGKVPDDIESLLQKMTRDDRIDQTRMMQQSLLADRFHLRAHFETRVLPVYELVPAKSGLKITEVPAPPERKPDGLAMRLHPGEPLAPGTLMTTPAGNGFRVLNGRAIKMQMLARIIGGDIGDRPIVDHTGFTGYFDITDLNWVPLANAGSISEPDAPSLAGALKEKLGLRIIPAKDTIEVLVIDEIERPTPN